MKLWLWLPAAGVVACLVTAAASGMLLGVDWPPGGALALAAVIAGTLGGLSLLTSTRSRPAFSAATMVLAASMVRLGVGLTAAAVLYFTQRPEVAPFWSAFLLGMLAVLAMEVKLVRPSLLGSPVQLESSAP
jgi:hypothetical protein